MIGAIIGAAASLGSALYSGFKSAKAAKTAKRNIEKQKAGNAAWYNRRYNEDGTHTASAQRLLTMTQDAIKNRNKQAAATQAVVGGTEESVAATKEANAKALAETASSINAQADARKDTIEQSYRNTDTNLNNQLNNIETQRAQNIANAGAQAISAAGQVGSAIDSLGSEKTKTADGTKAVSGGTDAATTADSNAVSGSTGNALSTTANMWGIADKVAQDATYGHAKYLGYGNTSRL